MTTEDELRQHIKLLESQLLDAQYASADAHDRINDLRADRDEERRKMAWQLLLMVAKSGFIPASEWPTAEEWAVVDAFLGAEVNR